MSPSAFIVSRFVNRNGITSWRVDGRLHGLRIRKNFKTRVEAGAEKDALDIKAAQSDTAIGSTATGRMPTRLVIGLPLRNKNEQQRQYDHPPSPVRPQSA